MKIKFLFIILTIFQILIGEDLEIAVHDGHWIKDNSLLLLVCNNNIDIYNDLSGVDLLTIQLDEETYEFTEIPQNLEIGQSYQVISDGITYKLYFSDLPLINITTDEVIVNEPKVLAVFNLGDTTSDTDVIVSYCGIEIRGASSQTYPKKSYDFELWEDELGLATNKLTLLEMREDDDWLLISMYNEPLRIRNMMNNNLWRELHSPYYLHLEPEAKSGISTKYVEISINNEYLGVYLIGEQVDKKQLKLEEYDEPNIMGELYKGISWGASTFTYLPSFDNSIRIWSGFEFRYPKEDEITDWQNLYDFVDFVMNSEDDYFNENLENRLVLNNFADYFIFLNLLRATDNFGKNIYLAKYTENEPYFYVPWDLDGTFGIIFDGSREDIYDDILENGLFSRLLEINDAFKEFTYFRWQELRNDILNENNLCSNATILYNSLLSNAIYEREILKWGEEVIDFTNLDYTFEWLENRLDFLDNYFLSLSIDDENFSSSYPKLVSLAQNYPNPFNPYTRINYTSAPLSVNQSAKIVVHNSAGQQVWSSGNLPFTIHHSPLLFDGSKFNSGIYYYSLMINKKVITTKSMVLIK